MSKYENLKQFLKDLNEIPHVSGYEQEAVSYLKEKFKPFVDELYTDELGNLIALKKGDEDGPKVMFMGHIDQIGMIVTHITDEGFIKFSNIGGVDRRNILAQEVIIHGKNSKIYGVIGIKPPHLTSAEETKKPVEIHDLLIDTGYSKEALENLIRPGDIITLKQDIADLQNNQITGNALDDTAGVATMYVCMQNLKDYKNKANVYYVVSVQEEVGVRGATTATYNIKPDIGIAIDVTFAKSNDLKDYETSKVGEGPVISVGPNLARTLFERLKQTAQKTNIPFQIQGQPFPTGTDARAIQTAVGGVTTGLLGVPLKYMHSTVEVISTKDTHECGVLMANYVISLNDEKEIYWEDIEVCF